MLIWTIAHEFNLTLFCCSLNIFWPKTHVSSLCSLLTISLLALYPHPLWVQCMKFDDMVNVGKNYLNIHVCNFKVHETSQQGNYGLFKTLSYKCSICVHSFTSGKLACSQGLYMWPSMQALQRASYPHIVPQQRTSYHLFEA